MKELLEKWNEYCRWCTENYKNGYTNIDAPDFVEFMKWLEYEAVQ